MVVQTMTIGKFGTRSIEPYGLSFTERNAVSTPVTTPGGSVGHHMPTLGGSRRGNKMINGNKDVRELLDKYYALESERDILKIANDEWDKRFKEVVQQCESQVAWGKELAAEIIRLKETLLLGETNFNRLKAELEKHDRDHVRIESELVLERNHPKSQLAVAREALQMLYDEMADYIKINHLGDMHHNQLMKLARAALQKLSEPGGLML